MRWVLIFYLIIISSLPNTGNASTADEKRIGSYYIPGLVINKTEGLFIRLHNKIITKTMLQLELIIEPTNRIQQSFKSNQLIGYFPELWQHVPKDKSKVVVSDNIWLKSVIVFTKKGRLITKLSDLEGLTIGAVRGYSYGEVENNKDITIQYVNREEQNVEKLLSGRIDAIIGDNSSTLSAVKNSKHTQDIVYDLQKPIDILEVFYVFQNTSEGIFIRDKVNIAIRALKQQGIIKLNAKTGESQIILPN